MASVILWKNLPSCFQSIEEASLFLDKRSEHENECNVFAVVVIDGDKVSAYTRRALSVKKK